MVETSRGRRWAEAGRDVDDARTAGAHLEPRRFDLVADFKMTGDQPAAVERLASGLIEGIDRQTL